MTIVKKHVRKVNGKNIIVKQHKRKSSKDEVIRLSAVDVAKYVRMVLKKNFPKTKFSVRVRHFSIDVSWVDGASYKEVEEKVGFLSGAGFEGMYDLEYYDYHCIDKNGVIHFYKTGNPYVKEENVVLKKGCKIVRLGNDYIFLERKISPKYKIILSNAIIDMYGWNDKYSYLKKEEDLYKTHVIRGYVSDWNRVVSYLFNYINLEDVENYSDEQLKKFFKEKLHSLIYEEHVVIKW